MVPDGEDLIRSSEPTTRTLIRYADLLQTLCHAGYQA